MSLVTRLLTRVCHPAGERAVAVALAEMDAVSPGDLMKKITLDGKVGAGYTRGARLRTRWPQVTNQGPTKRVTLGGKVGCGMSFMHTHT